MVVGLGLWYKAFNARAEFSSTGYRFFLNRKILLIIVAVGRIHQVGLLSNCYKACPVVFAVWMILAIARSIYCYESPNSGCLCSFDHVNGFSYCFFWDHLKAGNQWTGD